MLVNMIEGGTLKTLGGRDGRVDPPSNMTSGYLDGQCFSQMKYFRRSIEEFLRMGRTSSHICFSSTSLGNLKTRHLLNLLLFPLQLSIPHLFGIFPVVKTSKTNKTIRKY